MISHVVLFDVPLYDSLGLAEQQALLAALELLDAPAVVVTDAVEQPAGALLPPSNGKGED